MVKVKFWWRKPWCYFRASRYRFPYKIPRILKNRIKAEKQLDELLDFILDQYDDTDPHPPTKASKTIEEALESIYSKACSLSINRDKWF